MSNSMSKRIYLKLVLFVGVLISYPGFAAQNETIFDGTLARETFLLNQIGRTVERQDLGRILALRSNIAFADQQISQFGLAHTKTLHAFQQIVVAFRFSTSFFRQIETAQNTLYIRELTEINLRITQKYGFDDSPYTTITANVFRQMYLLVQQALRSNDLPAEVNSNLQELVAPLGNLIAIAQEGDRPRTFAAATSVHDLIVTLYPLLNQLAFSHRAFDVLLEIQGLNEYFAEYAQIVP